METIPSLNELLEHGDEFRYSDLIASDFFIIDSSKNNRNDFDANQSQELKEETSEQLDEEENETNEVKKTDGQLDNDNVEESQENELDDQTIQNQDGEENEEQKEEAPQEEASKELEGSELEEKSDELPDNIREEEQEAKEEPEEESSKEDATEVSEESELEEKSEELPENIREEEQEAKEEPEEESSKEDATEVSEESELEEKSDELPEELEEKKKENDFDDLMNNYEESNNFNNDTNQREGQESPSSQLKDITSAKIYKVFKKLVSLSYETFQKGTYKYNKREVVKHYLTEQKFKIMDDLVSPTFKPDVYVFDLSPSNNESLEMYVNAISSLAVKNSIIYLTYNSCVLRKIVIKKSSSQGIDVNEVANSLVEKYDNFDCIIFTEYRSLYEELKNIKDRKIYIFSDFDISTEISLLSQKNRGIVWFSTERNNYGNYYRTFPSSYAGYYVETAGISDIERYVLEKNKSRYRRRAI